MQADKYIIEKAIFSVDIWYFSDRCICGGLAYNLLLLLHLSSMDKCRYTHSEKALFFTSDTQEKVTMLELSFLDGDSFRMPGEAVLERRKPHFSSLLGFASSSSCLPPLHRHSEVVTDYTRYIFFSTVPIFFKWSTSLFCHTLLYTIVV